MSIILIRCYVGKWEMLLDYVAHSFIKLYAYGKGEDSMWPAKSIHSPIIDAMKANIMSK